MNETVQKSLRAAPSELQRILTVSAFGLIGFALLYLVFWFLHAHFPYLEFGADLVGQLKHEMAAKGKPFKTSGGIRIMAFGNSKTLAGFIPSLFDSEMAAAGWKGVESVNFGLPHDIAFVADLERMIERGVGPDVVLLTYSWPADSPPRPTFFRFIVSDQEIMDRLFPFRKLPRNFVLTALEAHGNPNALRQMYLHNERTLEQVETDRGYYFLSHQSHYPNDELPADFRLPTDLPQKAATRKIPGGPIFVRLAKLFTAHHIKCLFVPNYYRPGEFAPVEPLNSSAVAALAGYPNFGVLGPDYFIYPNRLFSDSLHLNRKGATLHTRTLAALIAPWLKQHAQLQ